MWVAAVATITAVGVLGPWATGAASAADSAGRSRAKSGGVTATLDVEAPAVEVKPAGKSAFVAAKDGRTLKAGDTVRTSATGRAQIDYADGSLTRLDVNTEYQLVKLANAKGSRKTKGLQSVGQTWHRVEKLTGDDSYKVEGANATAAVLGTAFVVNCVSDDECTFTAVIDPIQLTDPGPRNGTKTVTLTPGDQALVTDNAINPVTTLTQEELLAIQWIVQNLLADQQDGKSTGTSEVGSQPDPPPTRPASSPVVDPPPPAPPTNTGTGTGTGTGAIANQGPTAQDDGYLMPEDTLLVIAAPGVLGNDSDPEGTPLDLFLTGLPAHGSLTVFPDGAFVYFPDANFHGTDAWTYVAGDGEFGSNPATVTITVAAVNDAPVAGNDAYGIAEDTPLVVSPAGVLANDSDVDGNALTAVLADDASHGDLTLHADGSFDYTPDANFHGADTFTYRANDGQVSSALATVTITVTPVNDAPVAVADSYTTNEDVQLVVNAADGVLDNDSDPDGDPLTAQQVNAELDDGPDHGTVSLSPDGSFTYTPTANYHGADHFTYYAHDGNGPSISVEVAITVTSQNDTPVAVGDSYNTAEDTALEVPAPGVLGNDSDVEASTLTATLVADVTDGELDLDPDGSFSYSPDENFHGTDSFTYKVSDGSLQSNTVTVTITVGSVDDAPTAVNDEYETNEDTPLVVTAPGVLANDSDPDSELLTADIVVESAGLISAVPTPHGSVVLNGDGSFTYTPDENYAGEDSFQYVALDAENESNVATVTITVNPVNDTPVAVADSYDTAEGQLLSVDAEAGVLHNDSDGDAGTTLTATLVDGTDTETEGTLVLDADGSFTFDPVDEFTGEVTFTYTASDGEATSSPPTTVTITVHVPELPQITAYIHEVDSGASVSFFLATYLADSVTITEVPGEGGGTLYADGEAVVAPLVISPFTELTYTAPETEGSALEYFSWTATNSDGTTGPVTEYLWIGGAPVAPDIYEAGSEGQATHIVIDINNPGLEGGVTCIGIGSIPGTLTNLDYDFEGGVWSFDWTPPAGSSGTIVTFAVSIGFAPACDGPFIDGPTIHVGVDIPAPVVEVTQVPDPYLISDETAYFSLTATQDLGLPLSWEVVDYDGAPFGYLFLDGTEADNWFFSWTPGYYECDPITVVIRFSNGYTYTDVEVDLPYACPA